MSEHDNFNFHQNHGAAQGNRHEQFLEYQMPGHAGNANDHLIRGNVPPHYPGEMPRRVGMPNQRPHSNYGLPDVEFDVKPSNPFAGQAEPVQGRRGYGARRFGGNHDNPMPDTVITSDGTHNPKQRYFPQQAPHDARNFNNYQQQPGESRYHSNAMEYMNMGPQHFAQDLADGWINDRSLYMRCRQEARLGGQQAVERLLTDINRNLQGMGSPYHLEWKPTGYAQYGNRKLDVTFYGRQEAPLGLF